MINEDIILKFKEYILDSKKEYNLDKFIVSVRINSNIENKDVVKKDIREAISKDLKEQIDSEKFDANFILILEFNKKGLRYYFKTEIKPIYISATYNKFVQIPQTIWHCDICFGRGCEKCNFTGKKFLDSIQDRAKKVLLKLFDAKEVKFHGAGREDLDVYCIGNRPCVFEIEKAKIRYIDLDVIRNKFSYDNEIVFNIIGYTNKSKTAFVKETDYKKEYIVIIDIGLDREISIEQNEFNLIQETPNRVMHRRSDMQRIRNVFVNNYYTSKKLELLDKYPFLNKENYNNNNYLVLDILTDSGTYVKEFVSGDNGRTNPSLSSYLNRNLSVKDLIVKDFH